MRQVAFIGALLGAVLAATAQEAGDVRPQKEHEALKQFEGEWDVQCKWMMPGEEVQNNKGTETAKIRLGGFWLVSNFKGEFNRKPFDGHAMTGFDPQAKKYVAVWFGSAGPTVMQFEGEADGSGKTFTLKGDCVDPKTGKKVPHRVVWEITDRDHRSERVFMVGDGGKEMLVGEFLYTRKGKAEAK